MGTMGNGADITISTSGYPMTWKHMPLRRMDAVMAAEELKALASGARRLKRSGKRRIRRPRRRSSRARAV